MNKSSLPFPSPPATNVNHVMCILPDLYLSRKHGLETFINARILRVKTI